MTDTPLRIALVVSYFYPHQSGAERQALEQAAELAERGHQVRVITRAIAGLPAVEEVRGVTVSRCLRVNDRSKLFGVTFITQIARALRRLGGAIDIVHTHQALWEAAGTGFARFWLKGVPTVAQPASSGYYGEAEELMRLRGRWLIRRLILQNAHFVAISGDIERQWRALGVPGERITRIASGVDTTRYCPGAASAETLSRLPAPPRVVFTGRLHPQKNLGVLVEAWARVRERMPAQLVLAGEGSERSALESAIRERGLADSVCLLGALDDVADVLRAADLFVLPSVAEGMSNSLLEAMACGRPCLVSRIGGNVDLIEQDVTGVLLPHDQPEAWAEAILALLTDRSRAARMGQAALERVEREFALPRVVDRYVSLYRRLIEEARS